MKVIKTLFCITIFVGLWAPSAHALDLGVGLGSSTGGRTIPTFNLGFQLGDKTISGQMTGSHTGYYYVSAYQLGYYWTWDPGEFIWGKVSSGFGVSAYYSQRGYRESTTATLETSDDYALGPAIRVKWNFLGPAYLGLEAMYGLRSIGHHLQLSFQTVTLFSLGVSAW